MASTPYKYSVFSPYTPGSTQNYPVEYFSGVDVSIFFGDEYIDEIRDFQFTLEESVVPVYGYASHTANRMIQGTRMIRGSFSINMLPGDYLHEMLYQDYAASLAPKVLIPIGPLAASGSSILSSASASPPNPFTNPDGFATWKDQQAASYWATQVPTKAPDLSRVPYFQNAGFTIVLVYGDIDAIDLTRNQGRIRTIEGVYPTRVTQSIAPSGENISETWEFYAIDMNQATRSDGLDGYISPAST